MGTCFISKGPSLVGARIGGLLVAVSGLATAIIQGVVLKTAWIFGVAPGFSLFGSHIGVFVRISGAIVGLIWLVLGVLMAVIGVKRLVLVVAVGLATALLFLVAPGIESMQGSWGVSFPSHLLVAPVVVTVLLPMAIVICFCLCLWLARSRALAAKVVTIVMLSLTVLLAVSCAVRVFDSFSALWCYYLLTSGLFTIGWLVMIATVSRSTVPQNPDSDT